MQYPLTDAARIAAGIALIWSTGAPTAVATKPCGDFGECKVLIEINSTDGDIGFHFLMDGDDLNAARIHDPNGAKVFEYQAKGPMREQKLTETFAESAEPLCWLDPQADPEDVENIVTLREFRELWVPGSYTFSGRSDGGAKASGASELSYDLPAAPQNLSFSGSTISWTAGNDLGNCSPLATSGHGQETVAEVLDIIADPALVGIVFWEVVLEPDVDNDHAAAGEVFRVRVDGAIAPTAVSVPFEYLQALPADTPVKIEIGAVGADDNATFTEADGFCVNLDEGCED